MPSSVLRVQTQAQPSFSPAPAPKGQPSRQRQGEGAGLRKAAHGGARTQQALRCARRGAAARCVALGPSRTRFFSALGGRQSSASRPQQLAAALGPGLGPACTITMAGRPAGKAGRASSPGKGTPIWAMVK